MRRLEIYEFGWWMRILTDNPNYMYYFGPFDSYWEAEWRKSGYVQDLEEEKAKVINIEIEKCQPEKLGEPIVRFSAYSCGA